MQGNKSIRIAKNTLTLFVRMFVIMVINLYAVRWVLAGLGASDYGLFNAVAGVVTSATCVSSVLAMTTQRFYSYHLGRGENEKLQAIFSTSLLLVLVFCAIVLVLAATVGLWFINNKMNFPPGRLMVANIIFGLSTAAFLFSIIQIPFLGAVYAHEDINIFAIVSTADCLLKLLAACLVGFYAADRLIFYGIMLAMIAFAVMCSYIIIARRRYKECRYGVVKDKKLYLDILSFSTWGLYGSLAWVGMIQGSTILLNIFFGTITNASFSVANQVLIAINAFGNSIIVAFRPAIVKALSGGEKKYLLTLFSFANKFMLYFMSCVAIVFILLADRILMLWLGQCTAEMLLFSRLIIVFAIVMSIGTPITTLIQARGIIKWYHLSTETATIMSVPVAWILFSCGLPSYSICISLIAIALVAHGIRIIFMNRYFGATFTQPYLFSFFLPAIIGIALTIMVSIMLCRLLSGAPQVACALLMPILALASFAYHFGISSDERALLKNYARSYLNKIKI